VQINDPILNPETVALGTLALGQVFVYSGKHYAVTNDVFGGAGADAKAVLRLEDCTTSALDNTTQVVARATPSVTFN
jgi:hypothetical protein